MEIKRKKNKNWVNLTQNIEYETLFENRMRVKKKNDIALNCQSDSRFLSNLYNNVLDIS